MPVLLETIGCVFRYWAEQGGLVENLVAVAYQDDLGVGGIEVAARGEQDIVGGERANFFAIGFEVIVGQAIEVDRRELAQDTILRRNTERENAGQVALRAFEFFGSYGK